MEPHRICVAGSINVDLVAYVGIAQDATGYADGRGFQMSAGGKSLNTAMTIAALAPVQLLGRVGKDDFGASITRTLTAAGIDAHGLVVDSSAGTGVGHVRVSTAGEYDTVVIPGANNNFAPEDIDHFLQHNPVPEYTVLNLEVPFATTEHAARRFREAGATVVVNLSPVHAEARDMLPLADVVVLNADEARLVLRLDNQQDPYVLLEGLRAQGAHAVVLTLGSDGAAYVGADGISGRIEGVPATIVNTIGAGDSFLGGFVAALAAGYCFQEALAFADAAGRTVCEKATSYLTSEDRLHLTTVSVHQAPPTPKAPESTHG